MIPLSHSYNYSMGARKVQGLVEWYLLTNIFKDILETLNIIELGKSLTFIMKDYS